MSDKESLKESVAYFMRRAYERGLTTCTGGNISARLGSSMYITCSGKDKGNLCASDIAEVDMKTGKNLTPELKISIETEMHRLVYLARPDVSAVVHTHPVYSCYFSASDHEIDTSIIAESYFLLDKVVKVPYRLMGTKELALEVQKYAPGHDVLLMENHGALAFGKSLISAFDRLECLEQAARMTILSMAFPVKDLTEEQKEAIKALRK